jgi:hypothetical protein
MILRPHSDILNLFSQIFANKVRRFSQKKQNFKSLKGELQRKFIFEL